jgi:hypothetical protein
MKSGFLNLLRRPDFRALSAALLLCAYLFKALIPTGYMPDMQALQKGLFQITICTAYGAQHITVDETGQPASPVPHENAKSDFCPYGWAPQAALFTFIPQIFSSVLFAAIERFVFEQRFIAAHRYSSSQPRAPPAF